MTSVHIVGVTLGAVKVPEQKELWFGGNLSIWLKSGCVSPPGALQLRALCVGAVDNAPQIQYAA